MNSRMDLSPNDDQNGEWLEPSEEFPILFGLLTARANAQQKTKEKQQQQQQQSRRRILRLNRNPGTPSPAGNSNSVVIQEEPDSSIRENSESESQSSGDCFWQNSTPNNTFTGRKKVSRRIITEATAAEDDDDVPTSTTNDFDLIPNSGVLATTTTTSDDSEGDNPTPPPPPRKRSRLEECLIMPRLEVMLSQGHNGGDSYQRHLNNYRNSRNTTSSPPMKPGNVQEKSITTNSMDPTDNNSCSIPTLNLRELLASSGGGTGTLRHHRGNVNIWKSHQFRFEKRKYTRKFRDPETNDLMEIADDEERPFQCSQCDLKFKRSYHLTRHLTIHSREERFFCQGCKIACFQRKDNLLAHMRKCCPPSEESVLDKKSNLKPTSLLQLQLRGLANPPTPKPRPFLTKDVINNIISNNPPPPKTSRKTPGSHPEDPLSLSPNPKPKSWICLSEFMESAGGVVSGQLASNENVDDVDPVIGLDLEMVEISEVSPEESSSSSSFGTSEESLDFSTTRAGNKKIFQSQRNSSTKSLPPPNDNIGVNLILRREMQIGQDDDEVEIEIDEDGEAAMYPCGDCDAVFRNLHRLMKHSTTTHVAEVPTTACTN